MPTFDCGALGNPITGANPQEREMAEAPRPRRITLKGILKILFFPLLFMVNPKIYYMGKDEEEP